MLFPKPFLVMRKYRLEKQAEETRGTLGDGLLEMRDSVPEETPLSRGTQETKSLHEAPAGHEEHSFGEVFIHQIIETIEFVLGSISNTASYLRLWALSLAHAELSKVGARQQVFLSMVVSSAYKQVENVFVSSVMLMPAFFALAVITVGILLVMDVMECFLHTLRLHWVEFQNKFFKGEGRKYDPFVFSSSG